MTNNNKKKMFVGVMTFMVNPKELFDFVGVAGEKAKIELATYVAMFGSLSESLSIHKDDEAKQEALMVAICDCLRKLAEILLEYDVRMGASAEMQLLFLAKSRGTLMRDAAALESFEAFAKVNAVKTVVALTHGAIEEFYEIAKLAQKDEGQTDK